MAPPDYDIGYHIFLSSQYLLTLTPTHALQAIPTKIKQYRFPSSFLGSLLAMILPSSVYMSLLVIPEGSIAYGPN